MELKWTDEDVRNVELLVTYMAEALLPSLEARYKGSKMTPELMRDAAGTLVHSLVDLMKRRGLKFAHPTDFKVNVSFGGGTKLTSSDHTDDLVRNPLFLVECKPGSQTFYSVLSSSLLRELLQEPTRPASI